jgi:hypothetical protein
VTALTDEQRRENARRAIAEAFAERPPLVVDAEYKVIAGKDEYRSHVNDMPEQSNGEAAEEREG